MLAIFRQNYGPISEFDFSCKKYALVQEHNASSQIVLSSYTSLWAGMILVHATLVARLVEAGHKHKLSRCPTI